MYVHVFGAYFGLAVSKFLHQKSIEGEEAVSVYNSDLFAMIGNFIKNLWLKCMLLAFFLDKCLNVSEKSKKHFYQTYEYV